MLPHVPQNERRGSSLFICKSLRAAHGAIGHVLGQLLDSLWRTGRPVACGIMRRDGIDQRRQRIASPQASSKPLGTAVGSILHRRNISTGLQAKTQKLVEEARRGGARQGLDGAALLGGGVATRKFTATAATAKWPSKATSKAHSQATSYGASGIKTTGARGFGTEQPMPSAAGLRPASGTPINLAGGGAAGSHRTGSHTGIQQRDSATVASQPSLPQRVVRRTAEQKVLSPERLNLDNQQLTTCPMLQGEERLRLLNYQSNSIGRMHNLAGLPNLIFLDLYNNRIEKIENIESLSGLRVLMLGKNQIKVIEGLDACTKLDVLDLHSNRITEIGEQSLRQLRSLRVLNLAGNQIQGALQTQALTGLTSLTELNLRRNQITTLEPILGSSLLSLQRLFLSHNQIESSASGTVFESLYTMPQLLELSLEHNGICSVAFYRQQLIDNMKILQTLDSKTIVTEERRLSAFVCKEQGGEKQLGDGELTNLRRYDKYSVGPGGGSESSGRSVVSSDDLGPLSDGGNAAAEAGPEPEAADSTDESIRVAKIRAVLWDWQTSNAEIDTLDQPIDQPSEGFGAADPAASAGFSEIEDSRIYVYGAAALESLSRALKASGRGGAVSATAFSGSADAVSSDSREGSASVDINHDAISAVTIKFVSFEKLVADKILQRIQASPSILSLTLAHNRLRHFHQIDQLVDFCASKVGQPQSRFELNISDNPVCSLGLFRSYCIYKLSPGCAIINGLAISADEKAAASAAFRAYGALPRMPGVLPQQQLGGGMQPEHQPAADDEAHAASLSNFSAAYTKQIISSALVVEKKVQTLNEMWPELVREIISSTLSELDNADTWMKFCLDKYIA